MNPCIDRPFIVRTNFKWLVSTARASDSEHCIRFLDFMFPIGNGPNDAKNLNENLKGDSHNEA
jgi:hypothetical protein